MPKVSKHTWTLNKYFILNASGRFYFPDMESMIKAWQPGDHLMVVIEEE